MCADKANISFASNLQVSLSASCPALWKQLGNLETKLLGADLPAVDTPIYVCGLARSGSTLLLEMLAAHPDVATHRYRDFPFIMTPYIWNLAVSLNPLRDTSARERAHGDGMTITPDSPEALEEMVWMAFFTNAHDGATSDILGREDSHPAFERFYREHIQKILHAQKRLRYASKGNYNITRMAYLQQQFADARFIIPVREPASHIASLMRQHARFCTMGKQDPRVSVHMSKAGHFEFGLHRTPIHAGNTQRINDICSAWQQGQEVRGWALYWDMIYRFAHQQLEDDLRLRNASLVVKLEDVSARPVDAIQSLMSHCRLTDQPAITESFAPRMHDVSAATGLSDNDVAMIRDITADTASLFGYNGQ